jgi:hypothetical protein
MKRSEFTDSERLKVLELKADGKSYDYIVTDGGIHHGRQKVIECVKWFTEDLSWEEAEAYCGNNQSILRLRDDYLEQKVAEAEELKSKLEDERRTVITRMAEQEETSKSNTMQLRHELGLPAVYHYTKDGGSGMEF